MSARTSARALDRRVARLRGRRSHLFRVPGAASVLELGDVLVLTEFFRLMGGGPGPSALSDRALVHLSRCDPGGRPDLEASLIFSATGEWATWAAALAPPPDPQPERRRPRRRSKKEEPHDRQA